MYQTAGIAADYSKSTAPQATPEFIQINQRLEDIRDRLGTHADLISSLNVRLYGPFPEEACGKLKDTPSGVIAGTRSLLDEIEIRLSSAVEHVRRLSSLA